MAPNPKRAGIYLLGAVALATALIGCTPPAETPSNPIGDKPGSTMTGNVEGTIKGEDGKPIEGATVTVAKTTATGPVRDIAPISDAQGSWSFTDLPVGDYTLKSGAAGFSDSEMQVKIEASKTAKLDFVLKRNP